MTHYLLSLLFSPPETGSALWNQSRHKMAESYRTWPVLPLNMPEAMHDECITVLVGGLTLKTGMGRLWDLGSLTTRPPELLQPSPTYSIQHDAAPVAQGDFTLL